MAMYAAIKDGIVTNVILADSQEVAESITGTMCVESTSENTAYTGGTYDEETGLFTHPNPS